MKLKMWNSGVFAASFLFGFTQSTAQPIGATPSDMPIIFKSGTGNGPATAPVSLKFPRPEIECAALGPVIRDIETRFYPADFAIGAAPPRKRLDHGLLEKALYGYRKHYCNPGNRGPAIIVIVDFARHSSQPRLYRLDLRSGEGLDTPIVVAHGIGSDPDDDGFASIFGNVQDSLASSLGAARGGEIYSGINGISLRLDGLDPSNSQMRARDIVVHSYSPARRRYFNADLINARSGKPGASEGCFVIEPEKRDWILATLENGGYLYSGYGGIVPSPPLSVPGQHVTYVRGTGSIRSSSVIAPSLSWASEIPGETSGSQPTVPTSQAPTAQPQ
ncbi:MAG: murein L,D-transpeptidase catalytic domain-containing protein [Sphingorhabdus sp.]